VVFHNKRIAMSCRVAKVDGWLTGQNIRQLWLGLIKARPNDLNLNYPVILKSRAENAGQLAGKYPAEASPRRAPKHRATA
jgi:hypothetical protein